MVNIRWTRGDRPRLQESTHLRAAFSIGGHADTPLDELASRAASGDRLAFEEIYDRTSAEIFNYLYASTRDLPAAEDLASNVFLRAWRSAKSYRVGTDMYRPWLFAIARNEMRDHWRTNSTDLPLCEAELVMPDQSNGGVDAVDAKNQLLRAVSILTGDQRDVVVLRYYGDKSHQEIASLLGKKEGAVRALLMRALRSMREAMTDAKT
jgi:RNA polymerase sigma-70 factor (ECF subfamily)